MLEEPAFRPKVKYVTICSDIDIFNNDQIFRTARHPDAGEEEDFPLPDNASKMRRSVENAEHVGQY